MTSSDLIDDIREYDKVRGWRPRRVYMSIKDLVELHLSEPCAHYHSLTSGVNFMFDGTAIYTVRSTDVAARIREWDLAP